MEMFKRSRQVGRRKRLLLDPDPKGRAIAFRDRISHQIQEKSEEDSRTLVLSVLRRIPHIPPLEPVEHSRSEIQPSVAAAILPSLGIRVIAVRAWPAVVQIRDIIPLNNIVEAIARIRSNIIPIVIVVNSRIIALLAPIPARPPAEPVLDVRGCAAVAVLFGRAGVRDDVVFAAVGLEDRVGFLALVDCFVAEGVVAVERGRGHGEGREGVADVGAGEHVDEAAAVGLAAGVDPVLVDAVGLVQVGQEVAYELEVVGCGEGVAGAFPDVA
jgi:hypothetical protein